MADKPQQSPQAQQQIDMELLKANRDAILASAQDWGIAHRVVEALGRLIDTLK